MDVKRDILGLPCCAWILYVKHPFYREKRVGERVSDGFVFNGNKDTEELIELRKRV